MSAFDVWIVRFEPGDTPPAERLKDAFGIDAASARSLEQGVPKIVKHAVSAKSAGEMRAALESIGAVVECRPARVAKPVAGGSDRATVFHPPGVDLFPSGRISAIDPFAPSNAVAPPRISVDEPLAPRPLDPVDRLPEHEQPRRISASLLAISRVQQRRRFALQAVAAILAGIAILAIDWFFGRSVLRGEAGLIGIGFDALGIYLIGIGAFELVTALRS